MALGKTVRYDREHDAPPVVAPLDPDGKNDYEVDLGLDIGDSGDTISSVAWTATGLTISDESNTTTTCKAFFVIAAHQGDTMYKVECVITMTSGRIVPITFIIPGRHT